MENSFDRYQYLKSKLTGYTYKKTPLDLLTGCLLAEYVYSLKSRSIIVRFIKLCFYLFVVRCHNFSKLNKSHLFGWSIPRDDYFDLIRQFIDVTKLDFDKIDVGYTSGRGVFCLNLSTLAFSLKIVSKIDEISFVDRIFIFSIICRTVNQMKYLESAVPKNKFSLYVSFNSSFSYEVYLTLYLRSIGVKTFSLQHGMYYRYVDNVPFDVINYENTTAHYLLVWGQFTYTELQKIIPATTKLILFGKPSCQIDSLEIKVESKDILVCMPRKLYLSDVKSLMDILAATDCGYNFTIRFHPALPVDEFQSYFDSAPHMQISTVKSFEEEIKNTPYKYIIGFNTTVLFESTRYGFKVIVYKTKEIEFNNTFFTEFENSTQLYELLDKGLVNSVDGSFFYSKVDKKLFSQLFLNQDLP